MLVPADQYRLHSHLVLASCEKVMRLAAHMHLQMDFYDVHSHDTCMNRSPRTAACMPPVQSNSEVP